MSSYEFGPDPYDPPDDKPWSSTEHLQTLFRVCKVTLPGVEVVIEGFALSRSEIQAIAERLTNER